MPMKSALAYAPGFPSICPPHMRRRRTSQQRTRRQNTDPSPYERAVAGRLPMSANACGDAYAGGLKLHYWKRSPALRIVAMVSLDPPIAHADAGLPVVGELVAQFPVELESRHAVAPHVDVGRRTEV